MHVREGSRNLSVCVCERRWIYLKEVEIKDKLYLTVDEASALTNIGKNRIREIVKENQNDIVLMVGTKLLINRKKLEEFLSSYIVL